MCTYLRKKPASARLWCRQLLPSWPCDERFKSSIEQVEGGVFRGCPLSYRPKYDVTVYTVFKIFCHP